MKDYRRLVMPVIIVLAGGCGLVMQISSSGGSPLHSLCMFTTLSNIYVFLYYVMSLASSGHGVAKMFCPAWRFSAMISITLTGLVAAFMLGGMFDGAPAAMKIALFLLHDVVPVAVWIDYFAFARKGSFRKAHIFAGLLPALCYLIAAFAAAAVGHEFGMGGRSYPYPFMDIDKLGVSRVALICSVLALALAGLSALLVFADRYMAAGRK